MSESRTRAQDPATWRSLLYVPANRDRFVHKAVSSGAGAVILDLEDAVPDTHKEEARRGLPGALTVLRAGPTPVLVRVNRPWPLMIRDMEAVVDARVDAVIIPKSDDPSVIRTVDEILAALEPPEECGRTRIVPLIESVRGVRLADAIISASDRVIASWTGIGDLCIGLGAEPGSAAVTHAFNEVVQATLAHGRTPLGLPGLIVSLSDEDAFRELAATAKALGSKGSACIHPRQVSILSEVFAPSPEEIAEAERLVAGYEAGARGGKGAVMVGDTFVDSANYRAALQLLRR